MASSITLYDDDGQPVALTGEDFKSRGLTELWTGDGVDNVVIDCPEGWDTYDMIYIEGQFVDHPATSFDSAICPITVRPQAMIEKGSVRVGFVGNSTGGNWAAFGLINVTKTSSKVEQDAGTDAYDGKIIGVYGIKY